MSDQDATTRDGARTRYKRNSKQRTTNRAANRCRCLLASTHKRGAGRRCCRKHSGVPRNSASLLENLHKKSYGAKGEGEQREKRPELVRQHFVLSARDPFFVLVLLLL